MHASYSLAIVNSYISAVGNIVCGRYCYTDDLLSLEVAISYEANLPDKCKRIVSPLKPAVWELLTS